MDGGQVSMDEGMAWYAVMNFLYIFFQHYLFVFVMSPLLPVIASLFLFSVITGNGATHVLFVPQSQLASPPNTFSIVGQ